MARSHQHSATPGDQPAGATPQPRHRADAPPAKHALIVIVVGSSIASEMCERPLAYRLRERVLGWLDARAAEEDAAQAPDPRHSQANGSAHGSDPASAADRRHALQPVVCTDMWYLNDAELANRPVIAIGAPADNAATAMLSSRLATAFVIEQILRVHLDPDFIEPRAALWGATPAATASAVDLFAERYLDEFMRAVD